jgi:hypothetical protein
MHARKKEPEQLPSLGRLLALAEQIKEEADKLVAAKVEEFRRECPTVPPGIVEQQIRQFSRCSCAVLKLLAEDR